MLNDCSPDVARPDAFNGDPAVSAKCNRQMIRKKIIGTVAAKEGLSDNRLG